MVAAEGEFPKSGNDPLFNSEVNSFGSFGKRLKFIDDDVDGGTVSNSTSETTLYTFTITADTVVTAIFVSAYFSSERGGAAGESNDSTFRIKLGGNLKRTIQIESLPDAGGTGEFNNRTINFKIDDEDFTGSLDIVITGQNSDAHGSVDKSIVTDVVVTGY